MSQSIPARPTALALAVALALTLVIGAACTKVVTTPKAEVTNVVTASGQGKASATPDEADMTFGVTANSVSAKSALAAASKTAAKLTAAMKAQGIPTEDIQTVSIDLFPRARKSPPGRTYRASITLRVTIKDIDKVGDVIGAADSAGVTNISGPIFTVSDSSPYQAQALDKAVKDARASAQAMAKAAGKSLGAVLSVSSANANVPVTPYSAFDSVRLSAVPVSPGQMEITENVTVVYALK